MVKYSGRLILHCNRFVSFFQVRVSREQKTCLDFYNEMTYLAKTQGLAALVDPVYSHNRNMLFLFGTFQAMTLIFAVFISALKPWGKNKN